VAHGSGGGVVTVVDDPTTVAGDFYAAVEAAWNAADGAAFGAAFTERNDFVDIRGVHHHGSDVELGAGHQQIFDTIYRDSVVRYQVEHVRPLAPGLVLAHAAAVLEVPAGPLAGRMDAISTVVLVATEAGWRCTAWHNTLVAPVPAGR
jgi:uncharacterized protein (TIGR02246 family)